MTMKTYIYDSFDTSEDASNRASDKWDLAEKSGLANEDIQKLLMHDDELGHRFSHLLFILRKENERTQFVGSIEDRILVSQNSNWSAASHRADILIRGSDDIGKASNDSLQVENH